MASSKFSLLVDRTNRLVDRTKRTLSREPRTLSQPVEHPQDLEVVSEGHDPIVEYGYVPFMYFLFLPGSQR